MALVKPPLVRAATLRRRALTLAAAMAIAATPACAQAAADGQLSAQPAADARLSAQPVADARLSAQWRELRSQRGHFDGAAYNPDVDRWQGRKHVLMQALAAQAMSEHASRDTLTQRMGAPDALWRAGAAAHTSALEQARWQGVPRGEFMVYHWRGQHDRLIIALHNGRVVATGWLMALE